MPSNKKLLQAAAGNAGESLYVEDVFSTYLYDGNGTTQTITNDIDLDGEGGLSWIKSRSNAQSHALVDTERGANKRLITNLTGAEFVYTDPAFYIQSGFNSNGFDIGPNSLVNASGYTYASWTFRKAEKFFDVVTWTGDGAATRQISHNLGSTPAVIIIKDLDDGTKSWWTYHHSLGNSEIVALNLTNAKFSYPAVANTDPTDTVFTVSNTAFVSNRDGHRFVAYLFASDAGGFGDDDENIIKCGVLTSTSSGFVDADCGFEPQWLLIKGTMTNNWQLFDNMRGVTTGNGHERLFANTSAEESSSTSDAINFTATGFKANTFAGGFNGAGDYIYIAIRRPMKTPESGTEVFKANYVDNGASFPDMLSGFPVDMYFRRYVNTTNNPYWFTRLLGTNVLDSTTTGAEQSFSANSAAMDSNVGVMNIFSTNNTDFYGWMFKRATGFFDVVAYTGDGGTTQTLNHNLGVTPEFMIAKRRNDTQNWVVYHSLVGAGKYYNLNTTSGASTLSTVWGGVEPTSTQFTVGNSTTVNFNGDTYISYHFATLAGVSKAGSYTGTGSNVDVDCGFSAGARFILIKRSDSTGDWYLWDSLRGIVAGNDPYLLLNTTAAEVTNTDYVDPLSSGFTVTSSAPAALNASGGSYIFLAIA